MGDEPSAPGYMLLYGSLMTLLMTFFILLTSMGTQESEKKMNTVMSSIKSVFGMFNTGGSGLLEGGGVIVPKSPVADVHIMRLLKNLKLEDLQGLEFTDKPQGMGQPIKVTYDRLGRFHIRFPERMFFEKGKFVISDKALIMIQKMLALYFDTPYSITVAGFYGGCGGKEKNWICAFHLAKGLVDYLKGQGVPMIDLYPEAHSDDTLKNKGAIEIILRAKELLERS